MLLGGQREGHLDAGISSIDILVEMDLHNPIVIEADPFAEGILSDLEASVDVTAEWGCEIETDGEGQRFGSQPMHQNLLVRGLGERQPELLSDMLLIDSTGRR